MTLSPAATLLSKLPTSATRTVRWLAVASLASQILLVVTGGAVRLTASGLGCPTWPRCTSASLVNTPEMGIHGFIEFGNRTLTFVLTVIALAMLVSLWNLRRERRDLFGISVALLAGIPAQAVIGGISVLTKLNPWVVGCHFLISMALVALAALLVNRTRLSTAQARTRVAPAAGRTLRQLLIANASFTAAALLLGVMVTGSGPHAGDANAPRNQLNPDLITRIHVLPVYLLVAGTVIALVLAYRRQVSARLRRAIVLMTVVVFAQGAIGYIQHFTGLPVVLVALHMLGASLLTAAAANAVYVGLTRQPAGTREPAVIAAGG